jgi:pSer/pThr/pTyr-binding forkhead associated (FHA) protein
MSRYSMLFGKSATLDIPNFQLKHGTFVLGRSPSCDYVVNDGSVSRRHANITLADGFLTVVDLGSSNHTCLDGKAVESCTVRSGQSLRFGKVVAPTRRRANATILRNSLTQLTNYGNAIADSQ